MDHITEAILQSEQDLAATRRELRDAKALVAALEDDVRAMQVELTGLRSYAQRRGIAVTADDDGVAAIDGDLDSNVVAISPGIETRAANPIANLTAMTRTEAVSRVLSDAPGPMDRSAVHGGCTMGGRDDTLDEISLALSGLKRSGRAEKLGRGLWQLVDDEPATGS